MSKIKTRITKILRKEPKDALVIGNGDYILPVLLDMFNTVFIWSKTTVDIKAPNIVIKKELDTTFHMPDINAVFIDRDYVKSLDYMSALLAKPSPDVFIEGNDVIPREQTTNLYRHNYNCTAQAGSFHIWTRVK